MNECQVQHDSQLFSVRLWPEDLGDGRAEWRGQVRHLASGETRYFREWPALVAFLQDVLPDLTDEPRETA
jgi:chemotaxis methyl-accepting protein methylase